MSFSREFKFKHGDAVREKVTGFEGIITGTAFYITGCNQYLVVARSKDNAEGVGLWYDEGRLQLKQRNQISIEDVTIEENGCDILPNIGRKSK